MAHGSVIAPEEGNWFAVQQLYQAVHSGETGISVLPGALKDLLERGAWRRFRRPTGEVIEYGDGEFAAFVENKPTAGLGASKELVERLLADDRKARDLLDQAYQGKHGGKRDNVTLAPQQPSGNNATKALRRLRKDRPDLHAEVLAGDLSPHAAMVRAGFRRRTVSVPVDDVERTAHTLLRHLDSDAVTLLIKTLEANV